MIFSVVFGGAYGFIAGSKTENSGYDPHAFAIGVAFLFALACVALATFSVRLRLMRKKMRKVALHNEALADRNWELQEAEQRARRLFESQGDLIVLRDAEGRITYANDAYCELAQKPRDALIGTRFSLEVLEQGDTALEPNGTRVHDQQVAGPARPALDRLARRPRPQRRRRTGGNAKRRPRRHRSHRKRARAGRGPRPGRRGKPRQVALPRDGEP
jgi:PAS domain-containing protein